jgi:hypothetical protein
MSILSDISLSEPTCGGVDGRLQGGEHYRYLLPYVPTSSLQSTMLGTLSAIQIQAFGSNLC